MRTFKPSLITTALVASGLSLNIGVVNAAENDVDETEVIQISGVRTSILKALDTKRDSDVVGDFVGGGDLGVLPDPSIADSLGRLVGVTTVRENGQSSQLNIRGMNGDFIQTTLNGREQASTAGYSEATRWMSFDQYPAELISEAAVYKSPRASHIEGGVAGAVALKTINPLHGSQDHTLSGNVRLSYNDAAADVGAEEYGKRLSLSYTGKFLDETLGVAVGFSHLSQPNSFVKARAGADDADLVGYDAADPENGELNATPRAFQWQAGTGEDERNGILASIVYQPIESLKVQFDYFKSEFERKDERHGITASGFKRANASRNNINNITVENNIVTSATISPIDPSLSGKNNAWFEARTEDQSTKADSDSLGLNLEWNISENQTLTLDWSKSEGTKTRKDRIVSMHAYDLAEDANGNLTSWQEKDNQSFTYVLDGHEIPQGSFSGVDFTDLSSMRMSRYEEYPHQYKDQIDSLQLDYKLLTDLGFIKSIEIGLRDSERKFDSERGAFLYGSRDGQSSDTTCADNTTVPALACMPKELDGYVTVGSVPGAPDHLVITDFDALATDIFGAGNFEGKKIFSKDWTFVQSGLVTEDVKAYYALANFETELGDVFVTGNVGVRHVKTDVKSSGLQNLGDGNGISITDDVGVTRDNYGPVTYGPEYSDTLPSLNLSFELSDDDVIRFAAAKVMGRPPVGQLQGGAGSWNGSDADGNTTYNVWTKGSPYLDPFRATQYDLSYEHYFEDEGAFTFALFWKDIESLVEQQSGTKSVEEFAALGIEVPDGMVGGTFQTFENNDKGGYIRGAELAVTNTFTSLPGILSGLGATVSYSYTESETEVGGGELYGQNLPLPGLSKNVWSATVFWDIGDFSTHMNVRHRDEFILNMPIPGSFTPVWSQEYLTVDAQASYKFDNGMDLVFSISNLTDEPNIAEYGQSGVIGEYSEFGRQYYLGLNFKL